MTAIEIILIIIGFICLCASCFVAKKNSGFAEGEKENLSSELWTEKEEEKNQRACRRNFIRETG